MAYNNDPRNKDKNNQQLTDDGSSIHDYIEENFEDVSYHYTEEDDQKNRNNSEDKFKDNKKKNVRKNSVSSVGNNGNSQNQTKNDNSNLQLPDEGKGSKQVGNQRKK